MKGTALPEGDGRNVAKKIFGGVVWRVIYLAVTFLVFALEDVAFLAVVDGLASFFLSVVSWPLICPSSTVLFDTFVVKALNSFCRVSNVSWRAL